MALDITALDITVDESTGLTDDDVDKTASPYDTDPTVLYLLSLDGAGGLTSPEVAYKADFITATATGGDSFSSVSLTQSLSGTPFSTTVGVNSGVQTVDGNYVWLFLDPSNSNVVRGVIGSSNPLTAPAAGGTLAFSFALINTNTTTPDLYLVQYVALLQSDTTSVDERIDLTNKVFATLSATTTVSFSGANAAPGNHDFYVINSPTDASKQILVIGLNGSTANVSTQGFGVDNQSINPNETLQVDFVTGSNLNAGTASQIQYGSHLEDVTKAGFTINQITPSNPDKRVDITIRAYNNTGNEQGTDFFDGTATNPVDITSIKLTGASGNATTITADGTYSTPSGNVTITGLSGTGNAVTITGLDNVTTVDFTTATSMDRLQVTGVDANEGCDITEFHFQTTTLNGHTEEVGSFINFDDSGPSLEITGAVAVGAAEVVEASGAGGQSQASITAPTYNASAVDGVTPSVSYALALVGPTATGLQTTVGNKAITLVADSASQISGKYDSDGNGVHGDAVRHDGDVDLAGCTRALEQPARRGRGQHPRPQRPDRRRGDGFGLGRRQRSSVAARHELRAFTHLRRHRSVAHDHVGADGWRRNGGRGERGRRPEPGVDHGAGHHCERGRWPNVEYLLRTVPGRRARDRPGDDGGQPSNHAGRGLGHPDFGHVR
jgi:hypothetical protein